MHVSFFSHLHIKDLVIDIHVYYIQSSEIQEFIIYKVVKYRKILLIYNLYFIFSLVKI